jgi:hypothetical protein
MLIEPSQKRSGNSLPQLFWERKWQGARLEICGFVRGVSPKRQVKVSQARQSG